MRGFVLLLATVLVAIAVGVGVEAALQPGIYGPPGGRFIAAFPSVPTVSTPRSRDHVSATSTYSAGNATDQLRVSVTVVGSGWTGSAPVDPRFRSVDALVAFPKRQKVAAPSSVALRPARVDGETVALGIACSSGSCLGVLADLARRVNDHLVEWSATAVAPSAAAARALVTSVLPIARGAPSATRSIPTTTARSSTHPNVTAAPLETVHTADGVVGFRSLGRGTPLVLLTGKGLSIDSWPPALVDRLAEHHRVVLVDNAGVGRTSALQAPLRIGAMAQQVAAFLAALRLHRPAVLGWSMGGMVAQALAIEHPGSLSKLVLAATAPGDGRALGPSPTARRDLQHERPGLQLLLHLLFPARRASAATAYAAGLRHYPHFYNASPVETQLQGSAVSAWLQGRDRVGRRDQSIRVPTLLADGAEDGLNPVGNDRALHALIPDSQLVIYPRASHGFLFQDARVFARRVDRFLAEAPTDR